ncbi:MAG: thioredoxin family protein [Chitinophagaceae bacterium]
MIIIVRHFCRPLLLLCIAILSYCTIQAQGKATIFYPAKGLDNVLKKAAEEKKMALVYLTAKWCGPCRELEEQALTDSNIVHAIRERFYPVKWDIDSLAEAKALQKKYFIGVPAFFAFDSTGKMQYYFVGYANKKEFARSLQYAITPENDPVYGMKKQYAAGKDVGEQFLISYSWALLKNRELQASEEVFRRMWLKANEKTRLSDSVARFLVYHTDRRDDVYRNNVKKNIDAYIRATSEKDIASYLTSPLVVRLDSIIDKQRDTAGFFRTYTTYLQLLLQYHADPSEVEYARLYPLQFNIVYGSPHMKEQLTEAFNSHLKGDKEVLYRFIVYLSMWYRKESYAALRTMRPQLINWLGEAIAVEDRYQYNYFMAELYYEAKDKTNALKYGSLALERSKTEFPNKKPMAAMSLLEKINVLQN